MGGKFQAEDLFRIAQENLSDVERTEFIFRCQAARFRTTTSLVAELVNIPGTTVDERNLLERAVRKFFLSLGRGAR